MACVRDLFLSGLKTGKNVMCKPSAAPAPGNCFEEEDARYLPPHQLPAPGRKRIGNASRVTSAAAAAEVLVHFYTTWKENLKLIKLTSGHGWMVSYGKRVSHPFQKVIGFMYPYLVFMHVTCELISEQAKCGSSCSVDKARFYFRNEGRLRGCRIPW
jgi:hypothetical protein